MEEEKTPDRFELVRQELIGRIAEPITAACMDKRQWEAVVYPLGFVVDHPLAPGKKAFAPDGSCLVVVPVALVHRPLPNRMRFRCLWKQPGPPQHVWFGLAGVKSFLDWLNETLKRADDTKQCWYSCVRTMGVVEQPDPRAYHATIMEHDGSFVVLVLIGKRLERLPHPEHLKVWWG